jgi:hypothetical protein
MRGCSAGSFAVMLAILAAGLELCVSANLLTLLGIPYVTDGGAMPLKIHPGTYLISLAFVLHLLAWGAWATLTADPLLAVFLAAMLACLAYALLLTGTGNLIVLVDTFLPAGLLAFILVRAGSGALWYLRCLMQIGFAANALLALAEASAQATLIPLYLNDRPYNAVAEEFRPTALYDHPLTGAVMTMLALSLAPAGGWLRPVYICLMCAALIAFGGRTALVVSVLAAVTGVAMRGVRMVLTRDSRAMRMLLAAAAALLLGAIGAAVALGAGLGSRLASHLYWDQSAQVRLAQWQLLGELNDWQLLFGTRRDDLIALLTPLWLASGVEVIENFWLLMFASLGAAGFPLFAAGLASLLVWCWRRTGQDGHALLLSVLIVVSTSNSLGRKSTILVELVATVLCLARPRALPRPKPRVGAWLGAARAVAPS